MKDAKPVNLDLWPTKAEAAKRIGVGEKTIERLALGKNKQLRQEWRRQPGKRPLAVYNPDDVERVAQERRSPVVLPPEDSNKVQALATTKTDNRHLIKKDRQEHRGDVAPLHFTQRVYLTIPQAAEYTGLTQAYIDRKVKAGELPAVKDVSWKVRRSDLDKL